MAVAFDKILYGGDYNPDQWLHMPEVLEEDIRMMKKAHINTVSLGIFAWEKLEPSDGNYQFDWMEEIINRLYDNGISVILATPSGARPHWLADKYPEVIRVNQMRQREVFGTRHNHCFTSPAYRKKVWDMNQQLAKRFENHPAVIMWHISNEYGGECHCPLCQDAFRNYLKDKYHDDIELLNRQWNTAFWSHHYDTFEQIESPTPIGETSIHGLYLDWRRFVSDQTIDFCAEEIKALREAGAKKPATTNMMYNFETVNYHEMAKVVDVISWDNYPIWHKVPETETAKDTGMQHDIMRTLKKQPFILMESCPGATNWQSVSKLKKPGMLEAASIQALAHGSDSVLYFQIRKGRGGFEKFHGAVIDHYGKDDDRTYMECCQLGSDLVDLSVLKATETKSDVAVVYDWENRWALEESQGPRNKGLYYKEAVEKSYSAFRRQGLNVDMIDMTQALDDYKIVAAPMLYMFRADFEAKVRRFVEKGGIFILTYWSGVVDEYDLCVLGGTPGGLMDVMGLRSTEIDGLYDGEFNELVPTADSDYHNTYRCEHLCQLVDLKGAKPLFTYGRDFYSGTPAMTEHQFGSGKAYYICADAEQGFYDDVYERIAKEAGVVYALNLSVPAGVEVTARCDSDYTYVFIQNFNRTSVDLDLSAAGGEIIFSYSVSRDDQGAYVVSKTYNGILTALGTVVLKVKR